MKVPESVYRLVNQRRAEVWTQMQQLKTQADAYARLSEEYSELSEWRDEFIRQDNEATK